MASLAIYTLINEQESLSHRESNGLLDLDSILNEMDDQFAAAVGNDSVNGEGFLNSEICTISFDSNINNDGLPKNTRYVERDSEEFNDFWEHLLFYSDRLKSDDEERNSIRYIRTTVIAAGSLGYYEKAYIKNNRVTNQRNNFEFYSSTDAMIFENGLVILFFKNSAIESIKSPIKALIEKLGFQNDVKPFKLKSETLKKMKIDLDWIKAKLERIENEDDSTKTVSYEVDVADKQSNSKIDNIYSEKGDFVNLTCNILYSYIDDDSISSRNFMVNFYQSEDKISWRNGQFNCKQEGDCNIEEMIRFSIYITNKLLGYTFSENNGEQDT